MRHIVLINPASGKSDKTAVLTEQAKKDFAAHGEEFVVLRTEYAGHTREIARRLAETGEDTVIYACGGDGTLGEVADGIANCPTCALAPVPVGTGNDFIKCFGDGAQAVFSSFSALIAGDTVPIDLLRVGGRICLNIASAGLDAAVCARMPVYKRALPINGSTAYNLSLIHCFFTAVKNRYAFEIDGVYYEPSDYVFAVAANGRYYGGGYKAAPHADMRDGLIDFIRIPSMPRARMLSMVSSYRRGEHFEKYPFITLEHCRSVRYIASDPIPMNLDGEVIAMQNPLVTIEPLALRLVVPQRVKMP